MRPSSLISLVLLAGTFGATSALASDVVVSPGQSIQAAIDLAQDGDRVLLTAGTWSEPIDFHGKAIEVRGLAGAGQTVLDGAGGAPVVRFTSGEGTGSRLAGVTVRAGFASQGAGGVACSGSTPTLEDCVIRDNHGKWGGGVTGNPVMRRCLVLDNTSSLTPGGGIYGAPDMTDCVVSGNTVTSADGGGVYVPSGAFRAQDCVFVGNRAIFADSSGGGVVVKSTASADLIGCLIVGNSATGGAFAGIGGGVWAQSSSTTLTDCVVLDNTLTGSSLHGGGVYGPARLVNTIVRGNALPQLESVGPVSYSNVQGGFPGTGNLDADPRFVDEAGRDLHLLPDSPCIDAGDPKLVDADGSRSDIGAFAFATLYARSNVTAGQIADPSFDSLSATLGGQQALGVLAGPDHAGELYLVLGSLSGTTPGFSLGGFHVPLTVDAWFDFSAMNPNSVLTPGSFGVLDGDGRAQAAFRLPTGLAGASVLEGLTLHQAALVGTAGPATVTLVTDPVALGFDP